MNAQRKGDWIQTQSGIAYFPFDPRIEDINIHDIAHALSHICRYGGHSKKFYSVAEHSVLVAEHLEAQGFEPEVVFEGLMHDATEAYLIDLPQPIKHSLPEYCEVEDLNWRFIAQRFGMAEELSPYVKMADRQVLMAEKPVLLGPSPMPWGYQNVTPANVKIRGHWPYFARRRFMKKFRSITDKLGADSWAVNYVPN